MLSKASLGNSFRLSLGNSSCLSLGNSSCLSSLPKRSIYIETIILAGISIGAALPSSIHIVRPNEKRLVETFGEYTRTLQPGFNLTLPYPITKTYNVRMDMHKVEIPSQSIITREQLNAHVDAVAYYRVKDPAKATYNVDDYENTVPTLAQTTLRNVLGTFTLAEANSQRQQINIRLKEELESQVSDWGMEVISVELQHITPTQKVQESMNSIIIAEQEKIASENRAHAVEIEADGKRRAYYKEAEGRASAVRVEAEAEADAIRMKANAEADAMRVRYETANEVFNGDAVVFEKLRTTENSLRNNSKILLPNSGQGVLNFMDIGKNEKV